LKADTTELSHRQARMDGSRSTVLFPSKCAFQFDAEHITSGAIGTNSPQISRDPRYDYHLCWMHSELFSVSNNFHIIESKSAFVRFLSHFGYFLMEGS
jgi:hypothetical protein